MTEMIAAGALSMTKNTRVQVLLLNEEGDRFEAYCKAKGYKKSTLIARLIREHLDQERFETQQELFRGGHS